MTSTENTQTIRFTTNADELRPHLDAGGYPTDWLVLAEQGIASDETRAWAREHVEAVAEVLVADEADVDPVVSVLTDMKRNDLMDVAHRIGDIPDDYGFQAAALDINEVRCCVEIATLVEAEDADENDEVAELTPYVVHDIITDIEGVLSDYDADDVLEVFLIVL